MEYMKISNFKINAIFSIALTLCFTGCSQELKQFTSNIKSLNHSTENTKSGYDIWSQNKAKEIEVSFNSKLPFYTNNKINYILWQTK